VKAGRYGYIRARGRVVIRHTESSPGPGAAGQDEGHAAPIAAPV